MTVLSEIEAMQGTRLGFWNQHIQKQGKLVVNKAQILQECFILVTGTAATHGDMTALSQLVSDSGDYGAIRRLVNQIVGNYAAANGEVATVQMLAQNGLGLSMTTKEAQAFVDNAHALNYVWSDVFEYVINLNNSTLTNRAQVANDFGSMLLVAGKDGFANGSSTIDSAMHSILGAITGSPDSMAVAEAAALNLVTRLTANGLQSSVADGYVTGATVFADADGNGALSPSDWSTTTDDFGNYNEPSHLNGAIIAFGGTDLLTGRAFQGVLTSPAGATLVNPLTTLAQSLIANGKATNVADATNQMHLTLGVPSGINVLTYDPLAVLANSNAPPAERDMAFKVQKIALQIMSLLTQTANVISTDSHSDIVKASNTVLDSLVSAIALYGNTADLLKNNVIVQQIVSDAASTANASHVHANASEFGSVIVNCNTAIDHSINITDLAKVAVVSQSTIIPVLAQAAQGTPAFAASLLFPYTNSTILTYIIISSDFSHSLLTRTNPVSDYNGRGTFMPPPSEPPVTTPITTSVSVPTNGTYKVGDVLSFTVNTSENVTVNTGGGTPQLSLTVGTSTVNATYVSGSGSNALVFQYTVLSGDLDTNGITVGALSAQGGTLRDSAGNALALTLNSVASTASVNVDGVSAQTFTLTSGADNFLGATGDDTFNANSTGAFATPDVLDGGSGTDTLNVVDTSNLTTAGISVTNIETANLSSAGTINADTMAWAGLNTLNILASTGATTITAANTTAVSVTEAGAGQLADSILIDGGSTVTLSSIHQGTGQITVGGTTAPTGAVVVTTSVDAGQTGGAITITGGSTVNVTEVSTHATGTTVTAESAVTVNGGANTTSVTVTQAAVAAAANAVTAVTGVSAVNAVTAAPGTQGVTPVTAITAVTGVTAAAGVAANGAVSITDTRYNSAAANTISTVALNNYGAGSFIRSNALNSLALSGTAGTLAITNATNGAGGVPTANSTLALTLNGLSGLSNTITDTNNEINTLNVTTTGADSTLAAFFDTALTTLTVDGTKVLRLNAINPALTSITVSGAAGFNDGGTSAGSGFSTRGGTATFTTTSSGAINISIDATTQSFTGSTGVDTIRISSRVDATHSVTGGSSSSDELILEGGAYALTAATGNMVSGFETLGISANVTGTIDLANLGSGFTKFHIIGNSVVALTKVSDNSSLQVDKASTQVTMVYADSTGPADTVNVSLGNSTSDSVNFGTLIFKDAASVGIGTVNLVSNGVDITPGDAVANFNTVVITDNGLSNLNVSGTQGVRFTTINQATTQATSFTLNNTNTGSAGVSIGVLTDTRLNSLNFAGTGASKITTLTASTTTTLAIDNSGAKLATINAMTSTANLRTLSLTGNVQIGDGLVGGTGMTLTYTQGLNISADTDPAHIKLTMAGAGNGYVDNISLGNGNNVVTNVSTAGTVNLTLGTGSNYITLGGATTNSTGRYYVTLGAGTAPDYITVGTGGTTYATTPNYVITGVQTGDRISFWADSVSSANSLSETTPGASVAQTITAVEAAAAFSHGVAYAIYGGYTFIAQSASGTLASTDTTIIQLMGVHSLTASLGYVTVAS
jgi:S-layer protein